MNDVSVLTGINRAIRQGFITRIFMLASTPISIYLIATKLTPELQGYYYTMSSLLALQILFEMGLGTVLIQFFSHEFVNLKWVGKGHISGEKTLLLRINSILLKSSMWFAIASIILIVCLIPFGVSFLSKDPNGYAYWLTPWVLGVIGIAANLLLVPLISLESGSGNVSEMSICETYASLVGTLIFWILLFSENGLYGLAFLPLIRFLIYIFYFLNNRLILLRNIYSSFQMALYTVSWKAEIWPLQWRMSISWIAGYVVFQLFTPVVFYYYGPVMAGQIGIGVASANALVGLGLTMINARIPYIGSLVALKNWNLLDKVFYQTLLQGAIIGITGAVLGTLIIFILQKYSEFGSRFLPYWQIGFLLSGAATQIVISHFGAYLRAYKKEPLVKITVAHAITQGFAVWYIGALFSTAGIVISIFVINLLILPATFYLWKKYRSEFRSGFTA